MLRFSPVMLASALALTVGLSACERGGEADADSPVTGEEPGDTPEVGAGRVAENVPEVAAGRWRVTVASETGPEFPPENICLSESDSRAKKGLGERAAELPCDAREVVRQGDAVVTSAVCNVGGITRTIRTEATGDFSADYYVNYVENVDPPPSEGPPEIKRRIHARRMGDC